ncbi:MAG: alanine/ornithine racemase family PLP-dependent enzyme [Eubacteriales bacterium]
MKYPALIIDKKKLEENTRIIVDNCKAYGIAVTAVTKCYCAIPELAIAQVKGGANMLADSRIENLKKLKDIPVPKLLIRIPMLSQVEEVVRYADISLNSEISVIKALSDESVKQGKVHKVIFMIDLGDLREGCLIEDAMDVIDEIVHLEGVCLAGIGSNFSCFGGVLADKDNLQVLVNLKENIAQKHGLKIEYITAGNSASYHVMEAGDVPKDVNHFRLGEIILLGKDEQTGKIVENINSDVFTLVAEIIELKDKPSKPFGKIGVDAFGMIPSFEDIGIRKRAIFGIGRQDVKVDDLFPKVSGAKIIGASSDHMIVDLTDCEKDYKVGDLMEFQVAYGALLALSTSEYVSKNII